MECISVHFIISDAMLSPPNNRKPFVTTPEPSTLEQLTTQCKSVLSSILVNLLQSSKGHALGGNKPPHSFGTFINNVALP